MRSILWFWSVDYKQKLVVLRRQKRGKWNIEKNVFHCNIFLKNLKFSYMNDYMIHTTGWENYWFLGVEELKKQKDFSWPNPLKTLYIAKLNPSTITETVIHTNFNYLICLIQSYRVGWEFLLGNWRFCKFELGKVYNILYFYQTAWLSQETTWDTNET